MVKGDFKAHDTTFSKELNFGENKSGDNQEPQQNIFSGGVDLSGSEIAKDLYIGGKVCLLEKLNLSDARVERSLYFDSLEIETIDLSRAIVSGDAFVTGCVVKGDFKAHDTTFSKELNFGENKSGDNQEPQQNIFSGGVDLSGSEIAKDLYIGGKVCLLEKLNLSDARVERSLYFDSLEIETIDLSRAIVSGDAFVTGCVVKGDFKAHDTTFSKDLKFRENKSGDNQEPQQNIFSGGVDLSESKIGELLISKTNFRYLMVVHYVWIRLI